MYSVDDLKLQSELFYFAARGKIHTQSTCSVDFRLDISIGMIGLHFYFREYHRLSDTIFHSYSLEPIQQQSESDSARAIEKQNGKK